MIFMCEKWHKGTQIIEFKQISRNIFLKKNVFGLIWRKSQHE